ncbi:pyridoxal phosphate-dependent aminotransferase [Dactylosporangium sp. NPDC000555]|uniref:pyridoxal phosphate-dependent aminotransferase n=1 Tax=Dactylosporangium sp. NPDC000555 TaxID=3154260 RepID=UPI0033242088
MREPEGTVATKPAEWRERTAGAVEDGARPPQAPTRPASGAGASLGREVDRIDWRSTLYFWLENTLYVNSQGMYAGQYELSSGTNQLTPPRMFIDALREFRPTNYWEINTYTGPLGDTSLRDAVVNYENAVNGWRIGRDNVAVTSGAHEGIHIALAALRRQGRRRALVLGPQVPLIFQALLQEKFSFRELWSADPYALVPSASEVLAALERHRFDVVLLTSPNNPTGVLYRPEELEAIGVATLETGGVLVVDKILSDSTVPGSPMPAATCQAMGDWITSGRCAVVDSLSKRRAVSGLRSGYLVAPADIVAAHSMLTLGGCPPLLLTSAASADLNCSARLHANGAPVTGTDRAHAEDLRRMRATVASNFRLAREILQDYWVWDSKQPGCMNCVVGLRVGPTVPDDRQKCERLFTQRVSCHPLSTFVADAGLLRRPHSEGVLEARLTVAMEPARFEETMLRTRCALRALGA